MIRENLSRFEDLASSSFIRHTVEVKDSGASRMQS